ncbi:hypothetical protein NQZ68_026026 [Dissostichus eleginoides]|nr:hypothetical protein NQZ68_026026 [Dissostichus eleginoides]
MLAQYPLLPRQTCQGTELFQLVSPLGSTLLQDRGGDVRHTGLSSSFARSRPPRARAEASFLHIQRARTRK